MTTILWLALLAGASDPECKEDRGKDPAKAIERHSIQNGVLLLLEDPSLKRVYFRLGFGRPLPSSSEEPPFSSFAQAAFQAFEPVRGLVRLGGSAEIQLFFDGLSVEGDLAPKEAPAQLLGLLRELRAGSDQKLGRVRAALLDGTPLPTYWHPRPRCLLGPQLSACMFERLFRLEARALYRAEPQPGSAATWFSERIDHGPSWLAVAAADLGPLRSTLTAGFSGGPQKLVARPTPRRLRGPAGRKVVIFDQPGQTFSVVSVSLVASSTVHRDHEALITAVAALDRASGAPSRALTVDGEHLIWSMAALVERSATTRTVRELIRDFERARTARIDPTAAERGRSRVLVRRARARLDPKARLEEALALELPTGKNTSAFENDTALACVSPERMESALRALAPARGATKASILVVVVADADPGLVAALGGLESLAWLEVLPTEASRF